MRLQTCVGSVCGGGTALMCRGRDVQGPHQGATVVFGYKERSFLVSKTDDVSKTTNQPRANLDTIKARTRFTIICPVKINNAHESKDRQRREKTRRWETSFRSLFTGQNSYLLGLSGPQPLDSYRLET